MSDASPRVGEYPEFGPGQVMTTSGGAIRIFFRRMSTTVVDEAQLPNGEDPEERGRALWELAVARREPGKGYAFVGRGVMM